MKKKILSAILATALATSITAPTAFACYGVRAMGMLLSTEKSPTILIENSPTRRQKNINSASRLWSLLTETNCHSY